MTMNNKRLAITILSLSILLMAAPTAALALPELSQTFMNKDVATAIMMMPSLGILLTVFIAAPFGRKIGDKQVILLGLMLALIAGLIPTIINDFWLISISRLLYGAGIGLFYPFAIALISQYFNGGTANKLMGFQNATQSIFNVLFTLGVTGLLPFGWHATFWVYALAIIPIALVGLFLPKTQKQASAETAKNTVTPERFTWLKFVRSPAAALIGTLFFVFIFFMTAPIFLSVFGMERKFSITQVGILMACQTMMSFVGGVSFGSLLSKFKAFVMPVAIFGMGMGFLILSVCQNFMWALVGVLLIGYAFPLVPAFVGTNINKGVSKHTSQILTSFMVVAMNLSGFLSPVIFGWITTHTNVQTVAGGYGAVGWLLMIIAIIAVALGKTLQWLAAD
ncbi:MAG: MFS transporter [Lactobacillaceae bacterium]|jgi:MFS family permease|nr:MFS transporter [Lactobacillaceae bacterium]